MDSLPEAATKLQAAEYVLVVHQRATIEACLCGWSELGKSFARHQVAMLREAGLLPDEPEAARKQDNDAAGSG